MDLLGPDGKPMQQPQAPTRHQMPSRQEKFNLVMMMFTLMNREERSALVKMLRPLRRKLDLLYPNGMKDEDIKRDLEKAAAAVVPNEVVNAEPTSPESGTEQSVHVQPESDAHVEEGATYESVADDARGF